MKKTIYAMAALAVVLGAQASVAAEDEVATYVAKVSKDASSVALRAVNLAVESGETDEKNFVVFAKSLRSLGFGGVPRSPQRAMHGQKKPEGQKQEDPRVVEDRQKEMAQRMKMIGEMNKKFLQSLDANKDLIVDAAELEKTVRGYLDLKLNDMLKVDKNGDGKLSLAEYALAVPAKGKLDKEGFDWHQRGHFEQDDKNKDGVLDAREMISHTAEIIVERAYLMHAVHVLAAADKNKDGLVDKAEFVAINDGAESVWKKVSPQGKPVKLATSYTDLFWLPLDVHSVICK